MAACTLYLNINVDRASYHHSYSGLRERRLSELLYPQICMRKHSDWFGLEPYQCEKDLVQPDFISVVVHGENLSEALAGVQVRGLL